MLKRKIDGLTLPPHRQMAKSQKCSPKTVFAMNFSAKCKTESKSNTRALGISVVPIISDNKCVNFFSLTLAYLLARSYSKLEDANVEIENIFQKGNSAIFIYS